MKKEVKNKIKEVKKEFTKKKVENKLEKSQDNFKDNPEKKSDKELNERVNIKEELKIDSTIDDEKVLKAEANLKDEKIDTISNVDDKVEAQIEHFTFPVEEEKSLEKKQNTQLQWVIIMMIGILILITIIFYYQNNYVNAFNFNGLKFQKTMLGELTFYSTQFPVVSLTGEVIGNYAINFRKDPRLLEYIPVNVSDDTVDFIIEGDKFAPVFITLNTGMKICEDTVISMAALSKFLGDSGLIVKSSYSDRDYAKKNNGTYRWCDSSQFDTVIYVSDENETSIREIDPYCYKLEFNNCEILEVSEKFQLLILEEYAERFKYLRN